MALININQGSTSLDSSNSQSKTVDKWTNNLRKDSKKQLYSTSSQQSVVETPNQLTIADPHANTETKLNSFDSEDQASINISSEHRPSIDMANANAAEQKSNSITNGSIQSDKSLKLTSNGRKKSKSKSSIRNNKSASSKNNSKPNENETTNTNNNQSASSDQKQFVIEYPFKMIEHQTELNNKCYYFTKLCFLFLVNLLFFMPLVDRKSVV